MIGWYVHHVGRGHLHHAVAIAGLLDQPITGLSSLPRPVDWRGDWLQLPRDDAEPICDPAANGALHWAPIQHAGLRDRMAALAAWTAAARPQAMVVDVSVEVTALARLLGVPVVTFCLPGTRTDAPHRLAWELADAIIAPWPAHHPQLCQGLEAYLDKVHFAGAISRFGVRTRPAATDSDRVVVLSGLGGTRLTPPRIAGWSWTVLGADNWCADPWPELCSAQVVITHAGLAAVADVAAAGTPAVVVAQDRPFDEQSATAAALADDGITTVSRLDDPNPADWPSLIASAQATGGQPWRRWSDGSGAIRAASVIDHIASRRNLPCKP